MESWIQTDLFILTLIIIRNIYSGCDYMGTIKRNKIIISVTVISVTIALFIYTLLKSEFVGNMSFQYIYSPNTNEPLPILICIFLYFLLWLLCGSIPFSCLFFLVLIIYTIIHRKDKSLFNRRYHPVYESEAYLGYAVSAISVYTATFILIVLHASGIISVELGF